MSGGKTYDDAITECKQTYGGTLLEILDLRTFLAARAHMLAVEADGTTFIHYYKNVNDFKRNKDSNK